MSRMFQVNGKPMTTSNIFTGCRSFCTYCNARKSAETRLKHTARYLDGFVPHFNDQELNRKFKPGEFVFVSYMGDISWALVPWVELILRHIRRFPHTNFLIMTKAPEVFHQWKLNIPPHVYLGTTIESNRDYGVTKAPAPVDRFRMLAGYPHGRKFLSIEPIMDFDLDVMLHWVELLMPNIIEVGPDNYHNGLTEPSGDKVKALLEGLKALCPQVVEKQGLETLYRGRE